MKKLILTASLILIFTVPAYAVKISGENLESFAASFHIGAVSALGLGINFGIDAGIPIGNFEIGAEFEQSITDYEFDVSFNITKIGLLLRYQVIEDLLWAAIHVGSSRFTASKNTTYPDFFSGKDIEIVGEEETKSSYMSVSLDYKMGDLILTPRFYFNYIGEGTLPEFDLNLGVRF